MSLPAVKVFRRLCLTTLIAVYFLVLVGGVVRSTGSGMGCPDWPKCFGSWIPPTSVDQLPSDYKAKYSALREKKNQKFIHYLRAFGMEETANRIANDKEVLKEEGFNPIKTWIEYINRIVGVITGLLIAILFYQSFSLRSKQPILFAISFLTLIILIFQAWFGSIVVSTNLTTWTITVHMFIAILIIILLLYLLHRVDGVTFFIDKPFIVWFLYAGLLAQLIQIFFGTQVRSAIDAVSNSLPRNEWIDSLGKDFSIHRSFSWLVLVLNGIFFLLTQKTTALKILSRALFILLLLSLSTGLILKLMDMPSLIQPVHLVLALLSVGLQFVMLLRIKIVAE